jgi:hypothetical protein
LRQARFFAEGIAAKAGSDPVAPVECAFQIALGRPFSKEEKDLVIRFLERQRSLEKGVPIKQEGSEAEPAALTDLAHVLLNLNEFV